MDVGEQQGEVQPVVPAGWIPAPPQPAPHPMYPPPDGEWVWVTAEARKRGLSLARRNLRAFCALWFIIGVFSGVMLFGSLAVGR